MFHPTDPSVTPYHDLAVIRVTYWKRTVAPVAEKPTALLHPQKPTASARRGVHVNSVTTISTKKTSPAAKEPAAIP